MRIDEYTPDAISRALNFESFRDDLVLADSEEWLRILLTPSFDPEVCITLSLGQNRATLDCRTFDSMFWHEQTAADRPPVFLETAAFHPHELATFATRLRATSDTMKQEATKWVVLDGMGAYLVLHSNKDVFVVEANVGASDLLRKFVGDFVSMAHGLLPKGCCRNALGQAARYVDLVLPIDKLESSTCVSRILVLGDPESKKELIDDLARRADDRQCNT